MSFRSKYYVIFEGMAVKLKLQGRRVTVLGFYKRIGALSLLRGAKLDIYHFGA